MRSPHAAAMRTVRARPRLRERSHHHMPLPLRLAGLVISIALTLNACDTLAGIFSNRWNWVALALFVLVVVIFLIQRMRR